jgi:hypothetical protein
MSQRSMFSHFRPGRLKQGLQRLESAQGQKRRFGDVRVTSALPLKADIQRKLRYVSKVPTADISAKTERRCKNLD